MTGCAAPSLQRRSWSTGSALFSDNFDCILAYKDYAFTTYVGGPALSLKQGLPLEPRCCLRARPRDARRAAAAPSCAGPAANVTVPHPPLPAQVGSSFDLETQGDSGNYVRGLGAPYGWAPYLCTGGRNGAESGLAGIFASCC
jgi:hypothetical protein